MNMILSCENSKLMLTLIHKIIKLQLIIKIKDKTKIKIEQSQEVIFNSNLAKPCTSLKGMNSLKDEHQSSILQFKTHNPNHTTFETRDKSWNSTIEEQKWTKKNRENLTTFLPPPSSHSVPPYNLPKPTLEYPSSLLPSKPIKPNL